MRGEFTRLEFGSAVFVTVMVLLAAVAAWPIYQSGAFLMVVTAAVSAAVVLAVLAYRGMWPVTTLTAWVGGVLVVLGLSVAVPIWRDGVLRAPALFFAGLATSWKDLVTVDLPVGEYRNLLVPVLVVFLVGTVAALLLSWRRSKAHLGAVPVLLAMQWFGLLFGSDVSMAPMRLGGLDLAAPGPAALGISGLLACLGWLTWRARTDRGQALRRAAVASGIELARPQIGVYLRSAGLASSLVIGAVTLGLIGAPVVMGGAARQVFRSGVAPQQQVANATSPLLGYRAAFTDANYDQVLFSVTSSGRLPDRVRLATLTSYDGEAFTSSGSSYRRLAYRRDAGSGDRVNLTVTLGDLGTLWLPSAGSLASIQFAGDRAQALSDGFYHDPSSGAAVDTVANGLATGDSYTAEVALTDAASVTELTSPRNSPQFAAPDSLVKWLKNQNQPSDGVGLAELAKRLVDRGYLSHALTEATPVPAWVTDLGAGYGFRSSTAGHSEARIGELFESLNARQDAAGLGADSASLVAAVGDDEQFAVAMALVADQLGYRSRVVMGARLEGDNTGVPSCIGGVCRNKNLSVWTEVQGADGRWAAIDVTPQHQQNPDRKQQTHRDTQHQTQVRPVPAQNVEPPDSGTGKGNNTSVSPGLNLAWLWTALRVLGSTLLILAAVLGPFAVIVGAKALRRRSRRGRDDPVLAIAGGWDEFVDAKIDQGARVLNCQTRGELAASFGDESSLVLAEAADRAVFAGLPVSAEEVDGYWHEVGDQCRNLAAAQTFKRRVLAAISLASFLRPGQHGERRWRLRALKTNG
jgi:hypothetical protein